jgi:hypothetical protein
VPRRLVGLAIALLLGAGVAACGDDGDAAPDDPTDESPGGRDDGDQTDDGEGSSGDDGDGAGGDEEEVELLEPAELPAEATPFADALATTFATQGAFTSATPGEAACIATNVVAIIGADRFTAAGITPESFGANPDLAPVGLERSEAGEIYDVFAGCGVDYAAATIESIALEAADPDAARDCLDDVLDEAIVREMAIAALLGVGEESPEVSEAASAIGACTVADGS